MCIASRPTWGNAWTPDVLFIPECPERWKTGVIRSYVRRALLTCSSWPLVHLELQKLKQMPVNNHYSCKEIDTEIRSALQKFIAASEEEQHTEDRQGQTHNIFFFYKNRMTPNHKADERALKQLIKKNVTSRNTEDKLQVVINYKNPPPASFKADDEKTTSTRKGSWKRPTLSTPSNVLYLRRLWAQSRRSAHWSHNNFPLP